MGCEESGGCQKEYSQIQEMTGFVHSIILTMEIYAKSDYVIVDRKNSCAGDIFLYTKRPELCEIYSVK
jgi:hypothetical protein